MYLIATLDGFLTFQQRLESLRSKLILEFPNQPFSGTSKGGSACVWMPARPTPTEYLPYLAGILSTELHRRQA